MKLTTRFTREYKPFYDDTSDPEDRSSHLYPSKKDKINGLLSEKYILIDGKYLLVRNNSLTIVSTSRTEIRDKEKPYQITVNITTEAESSPKHPKELTDLIKEQGF